MDQEMTGLLLIFVPIVAVGAIVSMMGHAKNIEDREKGVEASKKNKSIGNGNNGLEKRDRDDKK